MMVVISYLRPGTNLVVKHCLNHVTAKELADSMASGRTQEAKTMVDCLVLALGGKDAA